jgi:hypothetical protein
MSKSQYNTAALAVFQALEGLAADEQTKILRAAAALYGVSSDELGRGDSMSVSVDTPKAASAKPLSLVELINEAKPATNSQRLAVFAYYREHIEHKEYFSKAELRNYFAIARIGKPGNYDRDFAQAVRDGWIHDDGERCYLTGAGANTVQAGFGGKAKPRGVSARR